MDQSIARLQCAVQHYDWGKKGSSSAVAKLHHADAAAHLPIDEKKPYAELWMGTHKNAPSKVVVAPAATAGAPPTTKPLTEWVAATSASSSAAADAKVTAGGKGELPYLFKVLSVATALSIQAHPTKTLGAQLRASNPAAYPDDNHKPEMTIAITRFEALCAFRPAAQVAAYLESVPELRALVGDKLANEFQAAVKATASAADGASSAAASSSTAAAASTGGSPWTAAAAAPPAALKAALQGVFGAVMSADAKLVAEQLNTLVARLAKLPATAATATDVDVNELVQRLSKQYPNDVGCFCPYLLNAIVMNVGDAIFLPANEPHAYLSGDCIEAMAASDNVVRAGLTPKFRDVKVLVDMLTYACGRPPIHTGQPVDANTRLYLPPVPEFVVTSTTVSAGAEYVLRGVPGVSIVVVVGGKGSAVAAGAATLNIGEGSVFVVRDGVDVTLKQSGSSAPLWLYRCSPNASSAASAKL